MFDFIEGEVLLVDKPLKWTSFDVVKKIRNQHKAIKVGHAGTLDPLATGLLIICTGKKTKQIEHYQGLTKEYTGRILLGKTTPTLDLEMPFDSEQDISHLTKEDILGVVKSFMGRQLQVPPVFSAIKIDGKRLYKKARKGKEIDIEIKPREIEIHAFEITDMSLPEISFRVICSKGTYIRSLARDVGEKLGVGACLSALRRTKIGDFSVENAWQITDLIEKIKENKQIANTQQK
ncbi:MAG: tRNA pseudouridine(55) synthase TruB [Thermoflexibacter sp.]